MVSPMNHQATRAHEPAVLYWDWEKTRTINRRPGLPSPKQPMDDKYITWPEQPRAGTLRRTSAFVEDGDPQLAGNDDPQGDKTELRKDDGNEDHTTKPGFPETLYSEAKRRAVEDMGSRFIKTLKKLDKNDLKEPVDFNPILERHWAELAEFYSAQVATVRKLERLLKDTSPSSLNDLESSSPPQLPSYLMSQLAELKLRPLCPIKSEKKPNFASYLNSEESRLLLHETCPTEKKSCITLDPCYETGDTKAVQGSSHWTNRSYFWRNNRETTTENSNVTSGFSPWKANLAPQHVNVRYKEPIQITDEGRQRYPSPPGERGWVLKPPKLWDLGTSGNAATEGHLTEPAISKAANISQFNSGNFIKHLKETEEISSKAMGEGGTEKQVPVGDWDAIITCPTTDPLIENHYATLAEAMKLASIDSDNLDENPTGTGLNIHLMEGTTGGTKTINSISGQPPRRPSLKLRTPPQPDAIRLCKLDQESTIGELTKQYGFGEETQSSGYEDIYRSGSVRIGSNASSTSLDNPEKHGTEELSKTELSVDAPYDTMACTPEEILVNEAQNTALSQSDKIRGSSKEESENPSDTGVDDSLPIESGNRSFSVSEDSYLFCGSTKDELEKLQMEVKDHLEKAEKKGALLVARWVDESGVKREKKVESNEFDKEVATNTAPENKGRDENEDNSDSNSQEERIEIYEFEYADDRDGGDDEDDDDEEMQKIMAWIALEDAKAENATCILPKDPELGPTMVESSGSRIEEIEDTTNSDQDEGTGKQVDSMVDSCATTGKGLRIVDEEEDDEDSEDSGGGQETNNEDRGEKEKCEDSIYENWDADKVDGPIIEADKPDEVEGSEVKGDTKEIKSVDEIAENKGGDVGGSVDFQGQAKKEHKGNDVDSEVKGSIKGIQL